MQTTREIRDRKVNRLAEAKIRGEDIATRLALLVERHKTDDVLHEESEAIQLEIDIQVEANVAARDELTAFRAEIT